MADEQEAHLKEHARFFDGLLSLIPASMYYEQDRSDQWQRKKQTKEQARAAKRAKLDPANAKSVKDVMDANDPDRREGGDGEDVAMEGIVLEQPMEGLKVAKPNTKKQKKAVNEDSSAVPKEGGEASTVQKLKAERKEAKKERKREVQAAKREEKQHRLEEKTKRRAAAAEARDQAKSKVNTTKSDENDATLESSEFGGFSEGNPSGSRGASDSPQSSKEHSPVFDAAAIQSGTSSISSFPDLSAGAAEKPKADPPADPKPSQEDLKLRLQKRLAELRAARKADKEDGTPKITRQELLEQRREKEAQRKAHKKAVRKEAKEAERLKREQEIAHGSPLMSPSLGSPAGKHGQSPLSPAANNFSFGRIAFENGQAMTPSLDAVVAAPKQKAPHHANLALQAAQRRTEKLAALDPEKRAVAAQKDMWNAAKKKANGERVRDDASLLKKTLKRKENKKKKSEKEWDTRLQGVAASQEERQKKREANLQKRKDEKGGKGKKKKSTKSKARPGFEGSFRAGAKGK